MSDGQTESCGELARSGRDSFGIAASRHTPGGNDHAACVTGEYGAAVTTAVCGIVRAGPGGLLAIWDGGWHTARVGVDGIEPHTWYECKAVGSFSPVPDTDPRAQAYYERFPDDRPAAAAAEPKPSIEEVRTLRALADRLEAEIGGAS